MLERWVAFVAYWGEVGWSRCNLFTMKVTGQLITLPILAMVQIPSFT
ncbi:hypothetical protein LINPERPRIM_LOCUS12144 [Linum perenne]